MADNKSKSPQATRDAIDSLFYSVATEMTDLSAAGSAAQISTTIPVSAPSYDHVSTRTSNQSAGRIPSASATLRVDRGHVFRAETPVETAIAANSTKATVPPQRSEAAPKASTRLPEVTFRPANDTATAARVVGKALTSNAEAVLEQLRQQLIDLGTKISDQLSSGNPIFASFEATCKLYQQLRHSMGHRSDPS